MLHQSSIRLCLSITLKRYLAAETVLTCSTSTLKTFTHSFSVFIVNFDLTVNNLSKRLTMNSCHYIPTWWANIYIKLDAQHFNNFKNKLYTLKNAFIKLKCLKSTKKVFNNNNNTNNTTVSTTNNNILS